MSKEEIIPKQNTTARLREEAARRKIAEFEIKKAKEEELDRLSPPPKLTETQRQEIAQRLVSESITRGIRRVNMTLGSPELKECTGKPSINKKSKELAARVPHLLERLGDVEKKRAEKLKAQMEQKEEEEKANLTFKPEIKPYTLREVTSVNEDEWFKSRNERLESKRKEQEEQELAALQQKPKLSEKSEKLAERRRKKMGYSKESFITNMAKPKPRVDAPTPSFEPEINEKSKRLAKTVLEREKEASMSVTDRLYSQRKVPTPEPVPQKATPKKRKPRRKEDTTMSLFNESVVDDDLYALLNQTEKQSHVSPPSPKQENKSKLTDLYTLAADLGLPKGSNYVLPSPKVYTRSPYMSPPMPNLNSTSAANMSLTPGIAQPSLSSPPINTVDMPEDLLEALLM